MTGTAFPGYIRVTALRVALPLFTLGTCSARRIFSGADLVAATIILTLSLASVSSDAQAYKFNGKYAQTTRASLKPTIDGIIQSEEWHDATAINDFTESLPVSGRLPLYNTQVYLKHDDLFLYIAVELEQPAESITALQLIEGKDSFSDDYFGLLINPRNDSAGAYYFHVTPNGIRQDGLVEHQLYIDEWDGIWHAKSRRTRAGWTAEIAIPYQILTFDAINDTWRIQFRRKLSRPYREYFWNINFFEENGWYPTQYGELRGIEPKVSGAGIDLRPSIAIIDQHQTGNKDFTVQPSLDLFYRLTPSLVSSLTLNTDFAGTEVDTRTVNLGQLDLFFPEKRDFFLQDKGIYEFGALSQNGRPFFSRRIGLSSTGDPLDITAGLKIAGKIDNSDLAVLAVAQDCETNTRDTCPVVVLRNRIHIDQRSYLGAIVTSGDPFRESGDLLYGMDYRRTASINEFKNYQINAWWQLVDSDENPTGNQAFGTRFNIPGDQWELTLEAEELQKNFIPPLGFVNRNNIRRYNAFWRQRFRFFNHSWLEYYQYRIHHEYIRSLDHFRLAETRTFRPIEFRLSRRDYFFLEIRQHFEEVLTAFSLPDEITVTAGNHSYNRYALWYESDASRNYSFRVKHEAGSYFHGTRDDYELRVRIRPNPHISITGEYALQQLDFPKRAFNIRIVRSELDLAFNSQWSWVNRIQYDNVSQRAGVFSRLKFEPKAGRAIQLVFNKEILVDDELNHISTVRQEAVLKLGFSLSI